jgi:KaiC/GvpD/RAD55 family RecA-like ATPase
LLDLSRAWGGVLTKATPLPDVWGTLASKQIKFRRGQVCMVAAAPNVGKSMFSLIYAIKAKVPTLFFSADTDTATVMMRAAAHASGHNQVLVEQNLSTDSHFYDKHFDKLSHIKWVFDSSPSLDDLELEIRAYVELYGIAPELIVIDNLMNVAAETDNEWAGLRQIMMDLHDMARKTEACVLVLHHVSEQTEYGPTTEPPPRRAVHGKVSQLPALLLTLGYDPLSAQLKVAAVKNRFGPNQSDGKDYTTLFVDYGVCQINDSTSSLGRMFARDAYNGNQGQSIVQQDEDEDEYYGKH